MNHKKKEDTATMTISEVSQDIRLILPFIQSRDTEPRHKSAVIDQINPCTTTCRSSLRVQLFSQRPTHCGSITYDIQMILTAFPI